ncbi:MAG: CHAD domain-containing protein [Rhodocyclaceae bacterium]
MPQEIELKLAIPAHAWRAVARHPQLAAAEKLATRKLINIYYDTPDLDLRERGVALRLRKQGGKWLQTVKCAGTASGGLSHRPEWEYPYHGEAFDFRPIDDDKLRQWLGRDKLQRQLKPVFTTTFQRQTWRVVGENAAVVLVMFDRGEIEVGADHEPIGEIELELEQGGVEDLVALARSLASRLPLRPEAASKAERGYHLFAGAGLRPHKSNSSPLVAQHSALEGFKAIALACIQHIQANEAGVITSPDPEFIHQMRVGIRRLRSAMRLFAPVVGGALPEDLSPRLGELAGTLGEARDWDVLISELMHPVATAFPDDERLDHLIAAAAAHRDSARQHTVTELNGVDYGCLMIDLLAAILRPPPEATTQEMPTLAAFAQERLVSLHRRVKKAAKKARSLDIGALHRLRIAIKRLRYALEFFAPIYPQRAVRRDVKELTRLQDDLGAINDIANAGPRLALCANEHDALHQAVAMVGGWYGPRYQDLMARLPRDMAAVAKHRFVWDK